MNFIQIKLGERYALAVGGRIPQDIPGDAVGIEVTAKSQRIAGKSPADSSRAVDGWLFTQDGTRVAPEIHYEGLDDEHLLSTWATSEEERERDEERKRIREQSEARWKAASDTVARHLHRLGFKQGRDGDFEFSSGYGHELKFGQMRDRDHSSATLERVAAMLDRLAEEPGGPPPFNDRGPFDND